MEENKSSVRFSCGFCTKNEFLTWDSLQQHMAECHVPVNHNSETFTSRTSSSSPLSSSRVTPDTSQPHRISPSGLPYSCEYCTMKFNSVNGLQRHTLTTHSFNDVVDGNQENVLCTLCNKVFQNAAQLTDHVKSMHDREMCASKDFPEKKLITRNKISSPRHFLMPEAPLFNGSPHFPNTFAGAFICSHCNAGLPDFESFRTHLKSHLDTNVKKFTCFECDGQFPTEDLLDHHVVNHFLSTTTEYGCQSCLKMFAKPDHLQKHLMDIHAHQLYQCALCKDIFESKVNIQVHFAVKHSNECHMYKCTSCNAVFRSNGEFHMHVKVAHLAKLQPFRCYICDMCFPTEVQMQIHFQSHKKPFSCIFCSEEFHVEFLLDRHIQEKHADQNAPVSGNDNCSVQNLSIKSRSKSDNEECFSSNHKKQLRCDICDASFGSESSLNLHRRQVHNIRISGSHKPGQTILSLFCAYCNEPCKSRTDLENHMKTHTPTNTSKHKCNICDEICPSAGTLAEHKLSHCKIVTDSTCVMCHTALKLEEHFHVHLHQHNPQGLPAPCVICRQTLMSEIEVQVHAKFHLKNAEPLYSCCVCGCQSSLQHLIITGTQENHTYMCKECFHAKGDDLRCSECNVKFENSVELEKHRSTHNRKTYQCIKCQMSFESETEIQAHVTTHVLQEGTNHACHRCPKIFDSPAKLQCHLIEHTFEGHSSYSCYMCSAVFSSPHLIQQHMLEHGLDTRPYDCSFCHQKFFFRAELDNHSFCHRDMPKELPSFSCKDCDKTFTSSTNLQNHSKIHDQKTNTSSLKCSLCPEMFDNSVDMQQHHFRAHADSELHESKKAFPCSECDQIFPCKSNLQGHLRIHTQGTKYTCTECNKEFALSRNLTIHMRSHSGVKPYECPICKKRFARKENRKAHIKSHSGQKPFMCPHCGKTFSRKCHVKEHMRIHITSTTHPCEMCTETFSSIAQLKCHLVDAHQKLFDFSCSVCNELFESSESLDQHLLKEHDVRTSGYNSSPTDELSESSLGQSSSSADLKDSESSECSSIAEESDTRDSPISATEDCGESQQTPEVAA